MTGGSGFIGHHLITALEALQGDIINIDVNPPHAKSHMRYWRNGDLLDAVETEKTCSVFQPDVIFNLAAETNILAAEGGFEVNTRGLENIILAMKPLRHCRLVHFSTQLVLSAGFQPRDDRDLMPYGTYGSSKAQSEKLLWEKAAALDWVIVRPTTVWGPFNPTLASAAWKYIDKGYYMLPAGKPALRSYGYVENVVDQVIAAATLPDSKVRHQVYFVGDEPISSETWINAFSRALKGRDVRRVPLGVLKAMATCGDILAGLGLPAPFSAGRFARLTQDFAVPMQKTFDHLGCGKISLEEGVRRSVVWYHEQIRK